MRSDGCFDSADRTSIEAESVEGIGTRESLQEVVWMLETAPPLELTCELL